MSHHTARIEWTRGDAAFTDDRYGRGHRWTFDGGVTVPASSSPDVVPPPLSDVAAVDPEEALVASAASCHMLWFLSHAARRGFVVERYVDEARGEMGRNTEGRLAITRITLGPRIDFAGDRQPTAGELSALHEAAHDACFIASSLRSEVVVEA